jgi:hypothetical protein
MDTQTALMLMAAIFALVNGAGAVWNNGKMTKVLERLARIETVLRLRGLNGSLNEGENDA